MHDKKMNNAKKPILIDALHINMGGALMILNHLINRLVENDVNFILLKDNRCPKLQSEERISIIIALSPNIKDRKQFYKSHKYNYSVVLCMGNIPPPERLSVPVYTYFHNVSLLEIPESYPLKWKIGCWLKRNFIRYYSQNTDAWVVQTSHTANLVKRYLPCNEKEVLIYPFYNIPVNINNTDRSIRKDYCFIGEYTHAKGHEILIEAWTKLTRLNIKRTLHLTVESPIGIKYVKKAQKAGAQIVNHGKIPFDEIIDVYNLSKAIIYPSLNESLGLGIIEAINAGCDLIGSDLPYMYSVCNPSLTFSPQDSDSIVNAILQYENGGCPSPKLLIRDLSTEFALFLKEKQIIGH